MLAGRHPLRLDLTPERSVTLSPHTRQVLARLAHPVTATAFTSARSRRSAEIEDLLALYRDAQPLFTSRMLDLDRSPGEAERLGVSNYNVVVLESDGRRERVDLVNEETLTAALLAVGGRPGRWRTSLRDTARPTHATTRSAAAAATPLRRSRAAGFDVRPLPGAARDSRRRRPGGPGGTDSASCSRRRCDALEAYVRRGGRLLVLADPGGAALGDRAARPLRHRARATTSWSTSRRPSSAPTASPRASRR